MICAVFGCNNHNDRKKRKQKNGIVSYFGFPRDEELCNKWIRFCRRKDAFNIKTSRICSEHFIPDDFERNMQYEMGFMSKYRLKLKPGSVPAIYNVPVNRTSKGKIPMKRKKMTDTTISDTEYEEQDQCSVNASVKLEDFPFVDVSKCEECDNLKNLIDDFNTEMKKLEEENCQLKLDKEDLQTKMKALQVENKNLASKLRAVLKTGQIKVVTCSTKQLGKDAELT